MDIDLEEVDLESQELEEAHNLCLRIYANMLEFNSTQDSVTAELKTWRQSIGKYLPPKILEAIPQTHKQLVSLFRKEMEPIIRIPACPADCSLLEDVTPTLAYTCHCDGKTNVAWRRTNSGNLSPVREFLTISLADVIRAWYTQSHYEQYL